MNSSKLSEWMQIIGIFAVVLSLIFVGLQMRQTQDIAEATLYQMRSDSAREMIIMMIENDQAREVIFRAARDDLENMSSSDIELLRFTCEAILGHFEGSHRLYMLDFLSQEQWDADRRQISTIMTDFCNSTWTDEVRLTYRASFANEIDKIIRSGD